MLFTFSDNLSYTAFLTTSLNLLITIGTDTNLSISSLSTTVYKLAKFVLSAKLEVSTCVISLRSCFVA